MLSGTCGNTKTRGSLGLSSLMAAFHPTMFEHTYLPSKPDNIPQDNPMLNIRCNLHLLNTIQSRIFSMLALKYSEETFLGRMHLSGPIRPINMSHTGPRGVRLGLWFFKTTPGPDKFPSRETSSTRSKRETGLNLSRPSCSKYLRFLNRSMFASTHAGGLL